MQTDIVFVCFVEVGDFIAINGDGWEVMEISDYGDSLSLALKDTEGDVWPNAFAPFDHVSVVTSFEETFEFEDVDFDA